MNALAASLFTAVLASCAYMAAAIFCTLRFALRRAPRSTALLPKITVLKPIAGADSELFGCLASFCDQDYPRFDVVFCLHAADDPARAVVDRVIAAYPACKTSVVAGHNAAMLNPKIANLAKPGVEACGDVVVIADSDVRVERGYLRALAASFEDATVGAATCLYGGIPNRSLASRLGALSIEDAFAPSVLVATIAGTPRYCLGATMAVRRSVLAEIGGLEALGATIADDYVLGRRVSECGYRVDLSRQVVHTIVPETRLAQLWEHELRWARTNRALAPTGYALSFVTFALPLAMVYLAVARNLWALALLALAVVLRAGLHASARRALRVTHDDDVRLIPLRDFLSLGVWTASLFGRTVRWRNRSFSSEAID